MKTLLKTTEELEGKKIRSVEISQGYGGTIDIITEDDEIMRIEASGNWDRCGDYEGVELEICTSPGFYDKMSMDLLTEEEIKAENEKREAERKAKEAAEKKKAKEAEDKMRKSELELLAKLKNKYETK